MKLGQFCITCHIFTSIADTSRNKAVTNKAIRNKVVTLNKFISLTVTTLFSLKIILQHI